MTSLLSTTSTDDSLANLRETEYLETCSAFSDVFVRDQRADGCVTVINWVRERLSNKDSSSDLLTQQAKWATWRLSTSSPFDDVREAFKEFANSTVAKRCTSCSTFYRSPPDPISCALLVLGPNKSTDQNPFSDRRREELQENQKNQITDVIAVEELTPPMQDLAIQTEDTTNNDDQADTQNGEENENNKQDDVIDDQKKNVDKKDVDKNEKKEQDVVEEEVVEEEEEEEEDPSINNIKEQRVWQYVNSCKLGYPGAAWSKLDSIFGMHPKYFESQLESHKCLMLGEGPLPPTWRNYIAIMAASRYNCHYLVFQQRRRFLHNGGDPEWLIGISKVPKKLRRLINLNALLAHRPWLLSGAEGKEDEISLLLSGTAAFSSAELAHAVCILATYHAQASFCHAMGCVMEPEDEAMSLNSEFKNDEEQEEVEDETVDYKDDKEIFSRLKKQHSSMDDEDNEDNEDNEQDEDSGDEDTQKDVKLEEFRQIDDMETLLDDVTPGSPNLITRNGNHGKHRSLHLQSGLPGLPGGKGAAGATGAIGVTESMESNEFNGANESVLFDSNVDGQESRKRLSCHVYCGENALEYKDFDISKDSTIFTQEYSWGEQCFALISHYLPKTGERLDQQFDLTYYLTYETFSDSINVDTLPFRRAIWYYVLRLYGICHDDYEYKEVNIYLNRNIKAFVKKSVCYPELITRSDFVHFSPLLQASEKCHIGLLILESRKQAEIIYGLRSIQRFQSNK